MRILIATVTAGAGHLQAAAAIESAWQTLRPEDQVQRVDMLDFVPRLQKTILAEGFIKLVNHAPDLWSLVFKKTDNAGLLRKVAGIRHKLARHANPKFVRHLKNFQPEIVISTHFMPIEVLGGLREKLPAPAPFSACVVTDFEAHALWLEAGVDLYCVATEETKASLAARSVDPHRIEVTGIPIAARFSAPMETDAIRRRYGLRDDVPVILILGGGFGMGPVAELLAETDKLETQFQVIVVAGKNEALRRQLAGQNRRHPTDVLGFVTNMQELMVVADLIITKPGGLTTSEALALGKPMFILNPIPGQEAANSDFLLEHGAATKVNRIEDVPYRLEQLLGSKKLQDMARAAKALGRPNAAKDVCRATFLRWQARPDNSKTNT